MNRIHKLEKEKTGDFDHGLFEPLSFTCRLGECRSELLPLLSEVSKVVSSEGSLSKTLKLVQIVIES